MGPGLDMVLGDLDKVRNSEGAQELGEIQTKGFKRKHWGT